MNINRRRLILAGVSTALMGIALPYSYYKYKTGNSSDIIISILERRLQNINVSSESFRSFANDYLIFRHSYQKQLAILAVIATPLRYFSPYNLLGLDNPLRRLEDNVVSNYLLSTDFFQHQANPERLINYIRFYDPIKSPCRNPFHMKISQS